jgi:ribonuclease R
VSRTLTKEDVLRAMGHKDRSVGLGELSAKLHVRKPDRARLAELLDELEAEGRIRELPGHRYRTKKRSEAPAFEAPEPRALTPRGSPRSGRLTMHPAGYGFVALDDGGPDAFVPPGAVGAALHLDRVDVVTRPSPKGVEGQVVGVLDRGLSRVSGVVRRAGGNVWLDPDDPRMRGPMLLTDEEGGDPRRGRGGRPRFDRVDGAPGEHVVAEIVEYPRYDGDMPVVRVVKSLGAGGVTTVEVAKLLVRDGVVEEFEPAVLDEAARFPDRVTPRERAGREDLREIGLTTIDPVDARDHDDAVWAERRSDGGFRVIVAIADVSHYVQPGTAIDRSAFARGCSIYLPDRAIPMLPHELSSNLASLVANRDRLCLAVEAQLAPTGQIESWRFIEGVMRSHASLTYEGVARALGFSEGERQPEADARVEDLKVLHDAAHVLSIRRNKRGSLDFDLPEGRVKFEDGEPVDVYRMKGDPGVRRTYRMIEELMLLANEIVATELEQRAVPAIYRVHGTPDAKKLATFAQLAQALGHDVDVESIVKPRALAKFLKKLEGKREAQPLRYLLLRAMQQATYDTANVGHFALALERYLHFTSPIRRYPDLEVHRVLRSLIRGEEIEEGVLLRRLKLSAIESSRLERRAMTLERDVLNLYRAILMREKIGEEIAGTITGIANHGFYTSLDSPFVDVLTPLEALGTDIEMDELGVRLFARRSGERWTLGDRLRVRIEDVSLDRREIVALPIGEVEPTDLFPDMPVSAKRERSSVPPKRERPGDGRRRRSNDERPSGGRRSNRSDGKKKSRRKR